MLLQPQSLLLTPHPHRCSKCGHRDNLVQSSAVMPTGCHYELTLKSAADLNRQVVKGTNATINFPELAVQLPPETQVGASLLSPRDICPAAYTNKQTRPPQSGTFNTIEGVLQKLIDGLQQVSKRGVEEVVGVQDH